MIGGKLVSLAEHRARSLAGSRSWRDQRARVRQVTVRFARVRLDAGDSRAEIAAALGIRRDTLNRLLRTGQR